MAMTAIESPDILEAQERLLKKRRALSQTTNRGQQIESSDFGAIADRCIEQCRNVQYEDESVGPVKKAGHIQGVPKLYRECLFDNFTGNNKLIATLQEITAADGLGVVLRGNTGCGKTHLAIAMARTIPTNVYSGGRCIFTTAPELLLSIRSSFRDGAMVTEEGIINKFASCELLILDDLGSEKTSEFAITTLYIILDRRIREGFKTIITTNLTQVEIEQVFGARIASRLAAMENIKINMPDYRKLRK